jgi:hypothetical protein
MFQLTNIISTFLYDMRSLRAFQCNSIKLHTHVLYVPILNSDYFAGEILHNLGRFILVDYLGIDQQEHKRISF